jgi:hypothetical protein
MEKLTAKGAEDAEKGVCASLKAKLFSNAEYR